VSLGGDNSGVAYASTHSTASEVPAVVTGSLIQSSGVISTDQPAVKVDTDGDGESVMAQQMRFSRYEYDESGGGASVSTH
jgi:hypothetical protein